jgi:hypothetical protein
MVGGSLQKKVLEGVFKTNKNYIICSNYFKDNFCRVPSSFHFVKMRVVSANHVWDYGLTFYPKDQIHFVDLSSGSANHQNYFVNPNPYLWPYPKIWSKTIFLKRFSDLQISTHEHPKRFQTGFEIFFGIFLPISTYHPWVHTVTTNWFWNLSCKSALKPPKVATVWFWFPHA